MSFKLPTWNAGLPPEGVLVALALRKWVGMNEGAYLEVVAGDPSPFLKGVGLNVLLEPRVTVVTGRVIFKGDLPFVIDEYGAPTGFYPDSVLAWSEIPDGLQDLGDAARANMVLRKVMSS